MKLPLYITLLGTLIGGVFTLPEVQDAVRVYLVSVITIVSVAINLLFRWGKIREWAVNRLVQDAFYRLLHDSDYREYITWKLEKDKMIHQEKKHE